MPYRTDQHNHQRIEKVAEKGHERVCQQLKKIGEICRRRLHHKELRRKNEQLVNRLKRIIDHKDDGKKRHRS